MPHFPKPFYRQPRKRWYVQIDGRQINLGPDKDAAFDEYYKIMSKPQAKVLPADACVVIIDKFLDWVQKNRAPKTYDWYKDFCQSFSSQFPDLMMSSLKPLHVQEWLDATQQAVIIARRHGDTCRFLRVSDV